MASDFKAALPIPVKWSTGDNKYDQTGKAPRSISLFIPLESAAAFAQYILNSAQDTDRHKTGKVWDYEAKSEVQVEGFYINGKGREGTGGEFGTINPASTKWMNGSNNDEALPF